MQKKNSWQVKQSKHLDTGGLCLIMNLENWWTSPYRWHHLDKDIGIHWWCQCMFHCADMAHFHIHWCWSHRSLLWNKHLWYSSAVNEDIAAKANATGYHEWLSERRGRRGGRGRGAWYKIGKSRPKGPGWKYLSIQADMCIWSIHNHPCIDRNSGMDCSSSRQCWLHITILEQRKAQIMLRLEEFSEIFHAAYLQHLHDICMKMNWCHRDTYHHSDKGDWHTRQYSLHSVYLWNGTNIIKLQNVAHFKVHVVEIQMASIMLHTAVSSTDRSIQLDTHTCSVHSHPDRWRHWDMDHSSTRCGSFHIASLEY